MPYDIKPISGSWRGNPETLVPAPPKRAAVSSLPSGYDWLRSQSFDYERYTTGTSPFAPDTIKGGLGASLFQSLSANRAANAVTPEPPALDVPIIGGGGAKQKIGQLSLDLLDPAGTIKMATGSFLGLDQPIVGPGGAADPFGYLMSKGVEVMGATAPARLTDYAFAPIVAVSQMAAHSPMPTVENPDLQYDFQKDPTYWRWVSNANPVSMQSLAFATVARTQDPTANPWLVEQLAAQFKIDKDKTSFLSTGDAGLDYMAIKGAAASRSQYEQSGTLLGDGGLTMAKMKMPLWGFLSNFGMLGGYNLTEALDPVTPEEDAFWASLPTQLRQEQFGFIGGVKMGTDFATMLPTLSAFGTVATVAKGAGGIAGTAYKGYDWTLRLSKIGMAAGLTTMTANWALESAWPADLNVGPVTAEGVHEFTKRVDLARPVSESEFAGLVNAIGYWSSGTMGAGTAISGGKQVVRKVGGALEHAGVPHPTAGMADLRLYAFGLGGSEMHNFASETLGLDAAGLKLSAQRLYLSETLNTIRRSRFSRWAAAVAGTPTHSFLDELPVEQRLVLANAEMSRPLESTMSEAEAVLRTHNLARQDMSFTKINPATGRREAGPIIGDDALREYRIAQRNARSWDDGLARGFTNEYGAPFMHRLAGADTPQALRTWLSDALDRLGGKAQGLPPATAHSLEWWHQLTRTVYHYGFDRWAGAVHAASEGAEEAARIGVMSQRHIFRNEFDDLEKALRGESTPEAQAQAFAKLMDKIEAEDWVLAETRARSHGRPGQTEFTPTPEALANHIEDIYDTLATKRELPSADGPTSGEPLNLHQAEMEKEGLWTLGYKPVNEAGEFVASKETRTGQHIQTRWLDYPLSNADLVELGNRGWLGNKMDAVTRGFRTWRLLEYQRGSLFRRLSSKTKFSATQIEAFHEGVLNISRKHSISPQSVGRAPHYGPGLRSISSEVETLAERVFGPGPHRDAQGNVINFRREIGHAYRQAYRLNLTAGLTSHLKASFGPIGEAITYGSEFMYVMWRFGLSPLFKGGELWESAQLNLMNRVAPHADPELTALYMHAGASGDPAAVANEIIGGDMMVQGMARDPSGDFGTAVGQGVTTARGVAQTADERAAAGLGFYALNLKEDHLQQLDRQAAAARATAFRERALGGEAMRNTPLDQINARILDLTDEAGNIIPGNEADLAILLRQAEMESLPPDVRAALEAYPGGAPTAAQLAEGADLRETAAAWRTLTLDDGDRLGLWQHAVDKGWMPDDEALRVWRRLDELVSGLEKHKVRAKEREAYNNGTGPLVVHTDSLEHVDLTDPITGQPVLRSARFGTTAEIDTALRSLRARRVYARKNLTIPSVDDLAHRLEVFAESVEAPKPILRSERVGPADALPEGYTLDPAEMIVPGSTGPDGQHPGMVPWLDLENTAAEDRGLWHTTTKTTAVLDTGLKSRAELVAESVPQDARDAVRETYDALGKSAADQIRFIEADGTEHYMHDNALREWIDGQRGDLQDPRAFGATPFDNIVKIADDSGIMRRIRWERTGPAQRAPEGLSATRPDQWVSLTTDFVHADTIASRLKLISLAANDKATGEEMIAHFWGYYENLLGDEQDIVEAIANALGLKGALGANMSVDESIAFLERSIDQLTSIGKFEAVRSLDTGLREASYRNPDWDNSEFNGYVGFAGGYEGARNIDPNDVGTVQVAVRSHQLPELDGPTIDNALINAYLNSGPGDTIRLHLKDGSNPVFIRFSDPNLTIKDGITGKTYTEAQQYKRWVDDITTDGGSEYGAITGVEIYNYKHPSDTRNFIAGGGLPGTERAQHRIGPDNFEVQSPGTDIYVVDPRTHQEPVADNEDDLLRQLRHTIDDQGTVIPGYERRQQEVATRLDHMRQEALNPDPVTALDEIPQTAEGITANLESAMKESWARRTKGKLTGWGEKFWDPIPTKNNAQTRQQIQMQREEFPRVLAGTGVEQVFREVAGPESQWADWLVKDRALLDDWLAAKTSGTDAEAAAALDRLTAHAGGDEARGAVDDLYSSDEWATISGLWALNLRGNGEASFGTHFFDQYRSPLLRGINHPVLGVYPASWAVKTAREWAKFLFDNRAFGQELRLGATPAKAISDVARSQAVTFAQDPDNNGQTWDEYMRDGPLGSTIFTFNLLMPGDWSSIPFPLSRTIREILRGNLDAGSILASNITYSGVTRDLRLGAETWGEWAAIATNAHDPADNVWKDAPPSIAGMPMKKPKKPPKWSDTPTR